MDDADLAGPINDQFQEDALASTLKAIRASKTLPSRSHCLDCGDAIPLRRQTTIPGVQRCVGCQEMHENWRPM